MEFLQATSKFRAVGFGSKIDSRRNFRNALFLILLLSFSCAPSQAGWRARRLQSSTTSVSFGNAMLGTSTKQVVTYTCMSSSRATIYGVMLSGNGFTFAGPAFPLTLSQGQSANITIVFDPAAAGAATGKLQLSTNASVTPSMIPLSGSGIQQAASLAATPASAGFGNVPVGSSQSLIVSLSNPGTGAVTISQATLTGSGFTMSGLSTPLTLAPSQSSSFTVNFVPAAAGTANGSISLVSNAANSPLAIGLSGAGTQPQISIVPGAVNFGTLSVGLTNSQTVAVSNPGTASLSVTQSAGPGTGFGMTGLGLPLTVAPGKSSSFTVNFRPTSTGNQTSSIVLVSNAPGSPTAISLNGIGSASTNQLSSSPASLSFGTIPLGTGSIQSATLTNSGTVNVTISQLNVSPSTFSATGPAFPITLAAGQSASFNLTFTPTAAGNITGSASVISTAADSPLAISLSGSGSQGSHSVLLDWTASISPVVGYYVYSGTQASGPFAKLNSTPLASTTFTENPVQSGTTYYYEVTAVDASGVESGFSNEVSVSVP